MGGLLSRIAEKIEFFQGTIFDTFPYLAPCLLTGSLCATSSILLFFFLPETSKMHAEEVDEEILLDNSYSSFGLNSSKEENNKQGILIKLKELLSQKVVLGVIAIYAMFSFTKIAMNELFSVWCSTRIEVYNIPFFNFRMEAWTGVQKTLVYPLQLQVLYWFYIKYLDILE